MSYFTSYFLDNLKEVLSRLVVRNQRVEIMPDDFWVIDKELVQRCDNLSFHDVTKCVSYTCLQNIPHVYDFKIRAKIFTYECDKMKAEINHGDYYGLVTNVQVRRDYILEDAFEATIAKGVDPRSRF